jgi:hypothetical protein
MLQSEETVPGIQHPGSTGVIYCSDRAQANGFNYASSYEWANLGQGEPEVGPIPNAPSRPVKLEYDIDALEYAPTTGVKRTCRYPYIGSCFFINILRTSRGRCQPL